jgi:sensor histidine kinase regulating citrate/malate metabolism
VSNLLEYSRSTLLFCLTLPSIFYIFGYTTVFNTNLFHPDTKYMVQLLFSCASIFYFLFLITYCHELSYRKNAELENHLLTIQTQQALKNLENYQKVSQQAAVSLHDQRHHLALLYGFLQDGRTDRAMDYIRKVMQTFHSIKPPQTYCRNSTVNLLLEYFEENASSGDVDFQVEAALPPRLSVSETDLCVLLSNILENAVKAAAEVGDEDKSFVRIRCHLAKGNLVLLVENSYVNEVILKDGVPCCTEYGHGFGTKSIVRLAEKYRGYCSFQTEGGVFTVKIVLPCMETE